MKLELDDYEVVNLKALFDVIRTIPLYMDTGDWFGQIYWKLNDEIKSMSDKRPNVLVDDQINKFHQIFSKNKV